jgi:ribosomal RNA assembly protein
MQINLVVPLNEKFFNYLNKNPELLKEAKEITGTEVILNKENLNAVIISKGRGSDVVKMRDFLISLTLGVDEFDAKKLLTDEYMLYLIDLKTIIDSKEDISRILARIIGEEGKIKKRISEATGCSLYISDSKIALIGSYDEIEYAKNAIQIIIDGSPHARLFKYLEKVIRERKMKQFSATQGY